MHITLAHDADLAGWRAHVRQLMREDVAPGAVQWSVSAPNELYAARATRDLPDVPTSLKLPRRMVQTLSAAIHTDDPDRFQVMHKAVVSLSRAPEATAPDDAISTLHGFAEAARKETAALRRDLDPAPGHGRWSARSETRPAILRAQATFMRARRVGPWALLSSGASTLWDGHALRFGPGDAHAPDDTDPDALWRRADTLCTADAATNAYWSSLPTLELSCEPDVVLRAPELRDLRIRAPDCHACPLWKPATLTVFGEGREHAPLMFVGEQPGDQEDLAGRPFVGPAGQLLDRCLEQAGIARRDTYVTNAVKHFRFVQRGPRRIHEKPSAEHIDACAPWLAAERHLVRPKVLVMLGASAAQAVLGRPVTIARERSRPIVLDDGSRGLVTTHPSYLLRVPESAKVHETARFIADLKLAATWIAE